ncbi:hypothetical protein B1987_11605 [Mycobacterium kansasii]|uniref:DUF4190 domain-containing protein n=1 Tax=Mycobacterium attenuatum TaxID=2341086 RepID=A0A498QAA3_9MYCO|nr:DUF4190 domain-containing protein [Mycobacterium attenuatum]ORB84334.1 hypothetical protein B1987_11605 [Mycobacterium kansasii]VBA43208.1 hypothetical protein LAUMK136_04972 [Mycobacterium attenuatum]VBA59328.1 hypothetical protein LAUMK191_04957 [Mycobacterium attenuatum]VBA61743.1 hypothetical protein LAUMK41_05125 [Mycobacterium attenuatum]
MVHNPYYQPNAAAVAPQAPRPRQSTNGLAVAAIIVSLAGALPFTLLGLLIYMFTWAIVPAFVLSATGIVAGSVALTLLRRNSQSGRGMAFTAIVVSTICLVGGLIRDILAFASDQGQLLSQLGLS